MKKFLVYLLPFILLTGIAIAVRLYYRFDPRYNYYNYSTKHISGKNVIVGDSKSMFGVHIENSSVNQFVNLSAWGARPYDNLKAMDQYHLKNNTVYVVVSTRNFISKDTSNAMFNPNDIQRIFDFNVYKTIVKFKKQSSDGKWEYNTHADGSFTFKHKTRPFSPYDWHGDSSHHTQLLNDSGLNAYRNIKLKHLKELIVKLEKDNTVYVIDLPERASFDALVRPFENKLFADIEQLTGKRVFDFGIYPDSLFYDSHHLNYIGQKIYSDSFQQFMYSKHH